MWYAYMYIGICVCVMFRLICGAIQKTLKIRQEKIKKYKIMVVPTLLYGSEPARGLDLLTTVTTKLAE